MFKRKNPQMATLNNGGKVEGISIDWQKVRDVREQDRREAN